MVTSTKMSNENIITRKKSRPQTEGRIGWNLNCDLETHKALDILGAWMVGKENMHDELAKSVRIPKTKVIKILALEKLASLKIQKPKSGGRY